MNNAAWQLQTPIEAFIFDCDGTLSSLEGIDELAKNRGVAPAVSALTAKAMGTTGINPELYQERLKLVNPTREAVMALGENYLRTLAPEAEKVIKVLHKLGKSIYIVSAGLYPAVAYLGQALGLPRDHVFAVNVDFNQNGSYLDFDRHSPLVQSKGKRQIVSQLKKEHSRLLYLGDGLNDYETHDLVTRFIGYGGSFYRENIAALCQFYFKTPSFSALLPLALTQEEAQRLDTDDQVLFNQGLTAIREHEVLIT